MKTLAIICRGHSASRMAGKFLLRNGFFMGDEITRTIDKVPPDTIYELGERAFRNCYEVNKHYDVNFKSDTFSHGNLEYVRNKLKIYLKDILESKSELRGWKLPETIFIYPFLTRLFPDFYYLYWTRSISLSNEHGRGHLSDKLLRRWGIIGKINSCEASWKIQYSIVKNTPRPRNFLHVRMEDFILDIRREMQRISEWIGEDLVHPVKVNESKIFPDDHRNLREYYVKYPMADLGYIIV